MERKYATKFNKETILILEDAVKSLTAFKEAILVLEDAVKNFIATIPVGTVHAPLDDLDYTKNQLTALLNKLKR